ncbi:helix-turn-helix transcriptional regulator [Halospeciosus flavus]|uniref:Helix-turn-helix transcriptional regulator n=1 Tax=Halospeciosus flavus TaxID=3032283 RepID=A0ABD5Z8J5_9EURY|nr:hypothetical protein [Halospeciosus flavus]
MTPREQVAYLFGSSNRPTLLRALHEDPRRPSELTTDYDVSRATVQRTLAGFCERDWTRRDGHTYRTTLAGDLVLERYDDLLDAAHLVDSTGDLLQTLGASARGLSTEMLADATVVTAESNRPHAPFEFYRDYLLDVDVDHCLSVVPVTNDFYGEAHQSLAERGVDASVVVDGAALDAAGRDHPAVAPAHETSGFDLSVVEECPPFGLTVAGEHVLLGAFDDSGHAQAYLVGRNESLRDWGEERYETLASRATPLEAADD